jgi:hypothetical protein
MSTERPTRSVCIPACYSNKADLNSLSSRISKQNGLVNYDMLQILILAASLLLNFVTGTPGLNSRLQ